MIVTCKLQLGIAWIMALIMTLAPVRPLVAQDSPYQPLVRENMGDTATTADETMPGLGMTRKSNRGVYTVSVSSDLDPVVINQFHRWTVHLETADGQPVVDAVIEISGGMPAHGHDMPYMPEVTRNLGKGDYLVEGMTFHMPGLWQVMFYISSGSMSDTVILELVVE